MIRGLTISFLGYMFLVCSVSAQNLYVPANATVRISDGALLHSDGEIRNEGLIAGIGTGSLSTDLDINNSGIVGLATDSELRVLNDVLNGGSLTSSGTVYLGGDWVNSSTTNLVDATLIFNGNGAQSFTDNQTLIRSIVMAGIGPATLDVPQINVTESLDLQSGILQSSIDKTLILESTAEATGGSETSYYDGTLVSQGTGFKYFPVGNNGHFGPVEFDRIYGIDPEIGVAHIWTNPTDPVPGENLIGVSSNGLWSAELISGVFDSSQLFMDFMDEDLANFVEMNDIDADYVSPVIAYADSAGGTYASLGVSTLTDTDSLAYGKILSDTALFFSDTSSVRYFAIAKAPLVPPKGVFYIPEVFSPNASNPANQTFRVFGERISREGFLMQIYNRKRILLYETRDFDEASTYGWDGTSQKTGAKEPSGTYFYRILHKREPLGGGIVDQDPEIGQVYLVR